MKNLLQSIQNKLAEIIELKYVDENWGQLDFSNMEPPLQWPVALIAISKGAYDNVGKNISETPIQRQQGTLTIEIIIADFKSFKLQEELDWKTWDLIDLVHNKLQGFSADLDNIGVLIRSELNRIRRTDGVQELRITYNLALHNC